MDAEANRRGLLIIGGGAYLIDHRGRGLLIIVWGRVFIRFLEWAWLKTRADGFKLKLPAILQIFLENSSFLGPGWITGIISLATPSQLRGE